VGDGASLFCAGLFLQIAGCGRAIILFLRQFSASLERHDPGRMTRHDVWGAWAPRWLLLRSGACQRLSTFSINSRNSAILALRFAASKVLETADGERRLRPMLVLSTSLYRCVIVCRPHHRLIQLCAVCGTSISSYSTHTNRIGYFT
jgi:hypothetical protein